MQTQFRFGEFELDAERGILRQRGTVLKLQAQPLQVLQYLLAHAPALVSREELGRFVWGDRGVHVDLDANLSYCVRQIRRTLGDSATRPVYVETLPRQGYRFVGEILGSAGTGESIGGAEEKEKRAEAAAAGTTAAGTTAASTTAASTTGNEVRATGAAGAGTEAAEARGGSGWVRMWLGGGRRVRAVALAVAWVLLLGAVCGAAWWMRRPTARVKNTAGSAMPMGTHAAAEDAYQRGLYFYNKRDAKRSAVYFHKAIDADPEFAAGYVGMANAMESEYTLDLEPLERTIPQGVAFARQAIRLEPGNGEAYIALGSLQTLAWNLPEAGVSLERGLSLNPRSSLGEMKYAVYLDITRRPEEAIAHMRHALQLDPHSFLMNRHLGTTLYFGRHYDEALTQLELAREMEPSLSRVVENWMSFAYEKKGMQAEAVRHDLVWLQATFPQMTADALERVYDTKGWKAYWQARLQAIDKYPGPCPAYARGMNAMRQGNRTEAFEQLGAAADEHCFWMQWTPTDPLLDELAGDARFEALLQRMKLAAP